MNSDSPNMRVRPAETRAQRYRNRSRELLEIARSAASEESRRDLEWVAHRYEVMASSAELIEASRQPAPALRLR
jgi:hypothetical protein